MEKKKDSRGRILRNNEDQMKNGRYRYRYTDALGKRQTIYSWKLTSSDKTPKGKLEDISLREKELIVQTDEKDGIVKSDDMTVNKLIERYLDLKTNLAVSTKENYTHIYEKNIKDTKLGKSKVKDIKKMDIQAFYAYLFTKRNFCRGTIQLYQNILFPAFQMAVDNDIIRNNPCNGCMKEYTRGSMSSTK